MNWKDIKYLAAFIIPALVFFSLDLGGIWSYSALIFAFVIIPIVEPFFSSSTENLVEEERMSKQKSLFFEILLYLNIPINFFLLYCFIDLINSGDLILSEKVGYTLSYGALLGSCGINVAHELGHKDSLFSKFSAVTLLIPSLYTHFIIEHNRGHHKNVATPEDPATARKNELIYTFWVRSVYGGFKNSWNLEKKRLNSLNKSSYSLHNLMIHFTALTLFYILSLYLFAGPEAASLVILSGIISFIFLETINYVEHYGLQRKKLSSGRYERVEPRHSWNSNHYLGRIILYELTRHSDHHFLANKKYQVLDHHDDSPQLPFGYPTSMLLSLIPPIWFSIMNKRINLPSD